MLKLSKPKWYDLEGLEAPVRIKLSPYDLMVGISSTPDVDLDPERKRTAREVGKFLFDQSSTELEMMLDEWEGVLMPDGTPAEVTTDHMRMFLIGTPGAYAAVLEVLQKHKEAWTGEKKESAPTSNGRRKGARAIVRPVTTRKPRAHAVKRARTVKSAPSSSIGRGA